MKQEQSGMRSTNPMIAAALVVASLLIPALGSAGAKGPDGDTSVVAKQFGFANVDRRAAELATKPYAEDRPELPEQFSTLNYDQYRDIRFHKEMSLWRDEGLPFIVQFFHRGAGFKDRVTINVVDQGKVTKLPFDPGAFDYGKNPVPTDVPVDMGFAGFRLHYPLNSDDVYDEVAVFLGASYFRAIGQNQHYGISARGLAIDTGLEAAEEFPVFREFWIEKPGRDATEIKVYALLDSHRATGAYLFTIRPGLQTIIDVKSHLFMREKVDKLGIAPLTSMFFHGETTERFIDDFRPEVHDSDGLLVESGDGERMWRPLVNAARLRINRFELEDPHGFGLLQRDREFMHYEDLEATYHARPSVWIEPIGKWGKGAVELVEIPSDAEKYDNVVAYWVPARPTKAGGEFSLEYRMHFAMNPEGRLPGGKTLATRIGGGGSDVLDSNRRKFVIDFVGDTLSGLADDAKLEAVVTSSQGEVQHPVVQRNSYTQGWRLSFEITPEGDEPIDLRAFLRMGEDVLSETWSFRWTRE